LLSILFVGTALSIMLAHAVVPHLHTGGQILLIEHLMEHHDAEDHHDMPPVEEDFCQLSQPFQPKPVVCDEEVQSLLSMLLPVPLLSIALFEPIAITLCTESPPPLRTIHRPTAFSLRGPPAA